MSSYEIEKMLNKGMKKEDIMKRLEEQVNSAQEAIEERKKIAAVRAEKEAAAEKMRKAAVAALKEYFAAVGYKDAFVDVNKNGVTVRLSSDKTALFDRDSFWDLVNRCF